MKKKILAAILCALICAMFFCSCEREGLNIEEDSSFQAGEAADSCYDLSMFSLCG